MSAEHPDKVKIELQAFQSFSFIQEFRRHGTLVLTSFVNHTDGKLRYQYNYRLSVNRSTSL